jgi:hypothetical protein
MNGFDPSLWSSLINYHRHGQRDDAATRQVGVVVPERDRLMKWEG